MLGISARKNKKYNIYNLHKDKWFHFGSWGQEDYHKHQNGDENRRQRFRNHKFSQQNYYPINNRIKKLPRN